MKLSIGDIVDKYTIGKLKSERMKINNFAEQEIYLSEIKKYEHIDLYIDALYKLHEEIWDIEADIRNGNEDILGLSEVGQRALQVRTLNILRINIKNEINSRYHEGFPEKKINHISIEKQPSLVITLTTVPERLADSNKDGIISVIESLCTQNDNDYQIHFNIPEYSLFSEFPYVIPKWLYEFKIKYPHLKIFRTEDYGPPTKFVPTIKRKELNDNTIILVVDDDLVYHPDMISEHRKYHSKISTHGVICYEGRGSEIILYDDLRDDWVVCVTQIRETHALQHYKSVSYRKYVFDDDFFKYYFGRTYSDDALVSKYFRDKKIRMYCVPYEPENHLFETKELWDKNCGVTTFPVIRHSVTVAKTGCHNPNLCSHPLGERFFEPKTLGDRSFEGPTIINDEKM
jgi:hypothetical protein